jgi:hypothetical protein
MRIYLDSRDLIFLTEKQTSTEIDLFENNLRKKSARLVFSMHNIVECCPPLLQPQIQTNVMKTLNRLDRMPHLYIADANITALELKEITKAFFEEREYQTVNPFVSRFDYVISPFRKPATSDYINYSLSEVIFDLWRVAPDVFEGYPNQSKMLHDKMELDRRRSDYKNHRQNFPNTLNQDLLLYIIHFPKEKIDELANWIWEKPSRCPSFRLGYEVYHKLLRNLNDKVKNSDIPDLAHVGCIPYVDSATLDNRIRGYIEQVDRSIGTAYSEKLYSNIIEVSVLLN